MDSDSHNCSTYIVSLLKEIVGLEAYRLAELRLRKKKPLDSVENKKTKLGSFEEIMNSRLLNMKK